MVGWLLKQESTRDVDVVIDINLDEEGARRSITDAASETGLPCDDPVRFGTARLLGSVLAAVGE